jgi:hypothetical protein
MEQSLRCPSCIGEGEFELLVCSEQLGGKNTVVEFIPTLRSVCRNPNNYIGSPTSFLRR